MLRPNLAANPSDQIEASGFNAALLRFPRVIDQRLKAGRVERAKHRPAAKADAEVSCSVSRLRDPTPDPSGSLRAGSARKLAPSLGDHAKITPGSGHGDEQWISIMPTWIMPESEKTQAQRHTMRLIQ